MRGDTTGNEVEADDHGGSAAATETAFGGRRAPSPTYGGSTTGTLLQQSIEALQNMLKKVSQSPFKDGEFLSGPSAAAATDVTDDHQNGGQERVHLNHQESGSKGHVMEDLGKNTSDEVNIDTIFVPPPEFQNSPLDLQPEMTTVGNGAVFSGFSTDLFQTLTPHFQTPTSAQNAPANGHFPDVTLNSPDLFKPIPAQTQNPSKTLQLKSSDLFKDEEVNLFQTAKGEDLLHTERTREVNLFDKSPSAFVDPFRSSSNKEDDLFQSPQPTTANPFYTATTEEAHLHQATKGEELFHVRENKQDPSTKDELFGTSSFKDVFSSSSTNTFDPFPSPVARDLFEDVSSLDDPFGTTPSRQYNPFRVVSPETPDIFKPLPSKTNSSDGLGITSSNTVPKATHSTPSLSSPSEMKLDVLSPPDLFKAMLPESNPAVQPKSPDRPQDIFLTTPQGTEYDILQPSPFSRARNLPMSPGQSPAEMTHVSTFRRPPKPLPRSRPPRPKPPKPERPPAPVKPIEAEAIVPKISPKPALKRPPKPAIHQKPKPLETKPTEDENCAVFEDVLLIGQERCVEDWPEDSPELNPDFKPSGTLRLRRESLKMRADSDGGSGEDQDGVSHSKKKDRKFRLSLLSRRGSKDKFPDDTKEGRSKTLPAVHRKTSKEYFPEVHMSTKENGNGEQNGTDFKKKSLKTKVSQLRRASTTTSVPVGKHMNGHLPQESKGDNLNKKSVSKKNSIIRRWSEGTVVDDSTGEEEEGEEAQHEEVDSHGLKKKKKVKIRFVPQRGFTISLEKGAHGYTPRKSSKEKLQDDLYGAHGYTPRKKSQDKSQDDLYGAHGYTPRKKSQDQSQDNLYGAHGYTPRKKSQDKSQDDLYGAHGYTPRKKSQNDAFEDVEARGYSFQSSSKAAFMDDEHFQKTQHTSAALNGYEDPYGMEDCKPKKPTKGWVNMGRRSSKEDMLDDVNHEKKKSSFSADDLFDQEWMEVCKPKSKLANGQSEPIGFSHVIPHQAANDPFAEDDFTQTGKYFTSPGDMYDSEDDEVESCKSKNPSKLKSLKNHTAKSKLADQEWDDPPGATSSDYLSEAAQAEWRAAQLDGQALAGLEDEDEEGDTDSLMEWWNTVEKWDEVPSDDEDKVIKEDECKSFTILADKVYRGLRVFNKVFTERAEALWQSIIMLHAIADNINNFHQKAKIAGITGGTTTAVGGVTAIAGLALAPFTFGASLVITAVGVGVATAGGITSASAAISDNVNNMHDRKKVELVLEEYETHLLTIGKILHFVNQGLYKLRGHPFLRSGTQHYSKDWEIRRAVQMISLVDSPVMRGTETTDASIASVQGLFKGMDKYFIKDSRELKKGCKKEVVCQIKEVANVLNDGIVELNAIREELQDATGNM